mmetsp:Transcript_109050/g.304842  ORF Transcript_109050/g.304842 Transcript_109050/m.304842 type:complete len:203 (+) Transcript_109050:1167-1775(+)
MPWTTLKSCSSEPERSKPGNQSGCCSRPLPRAHVTNSWQRSPGAASWQPPRPDWRDSSFASGLASSFASGVASRRRLCHHGLRPAASGSTMAAGAAGGAALFATPCGSCRRWISCVVCSASVLTDVFNLSSAVRFSSRRISKALVPVSSITSSALSSASNLCTVCRFWSCLALNSTSNLSAVCKFWISWRFSSRSVSNAGDM